MQYLKIIRTTAVSVLVVLVLLCSCASKPVQEAFPSGSPMADSIHFQFAVYFLRVPSKDPHTILHGTVMRKYSNLAIVDAIPKSPGKMLVSAHIQKDVQREYAPPDMEALRYFGRGISRNQAQDLQKCEQAFILDFAHPKAKVWEALRTANELAEGIARETGGLLWDEETREIFTPDAWHEKRLASWKETVPDVSDHTVIHAYKKDEFVRAITLGMSKFGLPDVVIEDFPWSMNRSMGNLVNIFCQSMAEGAIFKKSGKFDLKLRMIKNQKARDTQIASLKPNATAVAHLSLKKGAWEKGDPQNRLLEITFERYAGKDNHAKQEKMLSSLFGWEDSIVYVKHTDELLSASNEAKAGLPKLREAFTSGLQPGEYIQVKAPFATSDGGNEWMWVEVTSWKGKNIKGILKNEPFNIPNLHGGQIVTVRQEDVFDYIRRYPDGTEEGNRTGEILRKMEEEKNSRGQQEAGLDRPCGIL